MTEVVAAWAAVAAAIFSLVNVLLSSRLARKAQVQQWRRDSVRKTITDFLDATRELGGVNQRLLDEMLKLEHPLEMPISTIFEIVHKQGVQHIATVRTRAESMLSELELVASVDCVHEGRQLFEHVDWIRILDHFFEEDWDNAVEICRRLKSAIEQAREDFILACRADLGVD